MTGAREARPKLRASAEEFEEAGALLARTLRASWPYLGGLSDDALRGYALEDVREPEWRLVRHMDPAGRLLGFAQWKRLAFDSALYGFPMGRVRSVVSRHDDSRTEEALLKDVIAQARAIGIEHLHLRAPSAAWSLLWAAQAAGFRVIAGQTYFLRSDGRAGRDAAHRAPRIRAGVPSDLPVMQRITREAFSDGTRFHLDPALPRATAETVHARWIENAVNGTMADQVLVAELKRAVVGYVTCLCDRPLQKRTGVRMGEINLIAVDASVRGRGVGRALVEAAWRWFRAHRVPAVTVNTESTNLPAIRVYLASGFRVSHATYEFTWSSREAR